MHLKMYLALAVLHDVTCEVDLEEVIAHNLGKLSSARSTRAYGLIVSGLFRVRRGRIHFWTPVLECIDAECNQILISKRLKKFENISEWKTRM